jgi:photosystem II stability/assembly factor-like uncharacterized protein
MKKTLLSILTLTFTIVLNAQTWTVLNSGSTSNLKGIHFPTALTGYAVGDNGTILKTIDGGTSWTNLTTTFPGDWFWDVHFTSVDTGFVVGETDPGMNPCGLGLIIKTIDGGASWTTLISGLSSPPRDLFVVNKDTVFVCGGAEQTYSRIAKSVDGGTTWTQIGTPELDAITGGMYFLNSNVGFVGQYIFTAYASYLNTNNGSTFSVYNIPSSGGYWNFASDFPDASYGYFTRSTYVGSDSVYLRRTNDGGTTWNESVINAFTGSIYGLDFVDASTGYIVGSSGVIRKTSDGGTTWSAQTSNTTQDLRSVCFVNPNLGFAAGANGTILKCAIPVGISETNSSNESVMIYPNPSTGIFQLNNICKIANVSVYNHMGEILMTENNFRDNGSIDLSLFADGLYTILIRSDKGSQSLQVLKCK